MVKDLFIQNHRILIEQLALHRSYLYKIAKRKVKDSALAEDAVQNTLLAALIGIDGFRRESSLRTWLLGILNHQILKAFEREGRFVRVDGFLPYANDDDSDTNRISTFESAQEIDDSVNPERLMMSQQKLLAVASVIDSLPVGLRAIVQLHIVEGHDTETVCKLLKISTANFWVRLHRVRERLKAGSDSA